MTTEKTITIIMLFLWPLWPRISLPQSSCKISLPLPAVQVQPHSGQVKELLNQENSSWRRTNKNLLFLKFEGQWEEHSWNFMHSCLVDGKLLLSVQEKALDAVLRLLFSVSCSPCLCVCRMLVQLPAPNGHHGPSTSQAGASGFVTVRS